VLSLIGWSVIPLLISVAYFTIAERKMMGSIQRRRGPNVIGYLGLLQPLADGLKLFVKETILPSNSNIYMFLLAPILSFVLSLIGWSVIPLLISVAYFTIAERKMMGSIQRRRGPNVIGYLGLLQPLADGLKLFVKETILPSNSNIYMFLLAPILSFVLSLIGWSVIPLSKNVVISDINLGILYLFSVSSLSVYGLIMAGWSSNSKYPFLGSLRSAAQMVSYEVSIGFIIVNVCLCAGSFNLSNIIIAQEKVWYIIPLLPMFVLFYVSMLAETNRHPFDLPEAEAELVSGYNVEYSAMTFALFFLGEYANMLLMSAFSSILCLSCSS
jgi:NADH-quinone oxidoreductase subunit H